ncbi:hypothetical protein [Candidatus Uabimicrobium amorphum]|uniref:Trehalose synthase n=1 Tax=Uabimicrobium amorphum TaxID=2596890 RepID=A0A5S9F417_UABAM|nr:hypothetical protein [Candidatus Uabimicrobium amorphum]BBM83742.1 trehalose synthase [Candidatus Uabimicrobium amorphum]
MKHFYKNTSFIQKLSSYITTQRWYRGKAETLHNISIDDVIEIGKEQYLLIVTTHSNSAHNKYVVTLIVSVTHKNKPLFDFCENDQMLFVYDGCEDEEYCKNLWQIISSSQNDELQSFVIDNSVDLAVQKAHTPNSEQSNTNIIYDDKWLVKIFRQPQFGANPDLEINVFLSENRFPHVPKTIAGLRYISAEGKSMDIAIVQQLVDGASDCWEYVVQLASDYLSQSTQENFTRHSIFSGFKKTPNTMEASVQFAKLLGQRTAQLHLALANSDNANFSPQRIDSTYLTNLYDGFCEILSEVADLLQKTEPTANIARFLEATPLLKKHFESLITSPIEGYCIRCHGDYHLGQVLKINSDVVILDFEGEPLRTIEERRQKQSPFKDIAGMIRSFNYAGFKAAIDLNNENFPKINFWGNTMAITFLNEYLNVANGGQFLSQNKQQQQVLLQLFLFDKALYELKYELNNRPDWLHIPLCGIISLLEDIQ